MIPRAAALSRAVWAVTSALGVEPAPRTSVLRRDRTPTLATPRLADFLRSFKPDLMRFATPPPPCAPASTGRRSRGILARHEGVDKPTDDVTGPRAAPCAGRIPGGRGHRGQPRAGSGTRGDCGRAVRRVGRQGGVRDRVLSAVLRSAVAHWRDALHRPHSNAGRRPGKTRRGRAPPGHHLSVYRGASCRGGNG